MRLAPRPLKPTSRLVAVAALAFLAAGGVTAEERDPRAVEVAHRLVDALGGRQAFEAARLARFDFRVERGGETLALYRHWWDRHRGDYRLEGVDRESGLPFRVLFDVSSREGRAWLGDRELSGEEADAWLERAYGRYINDSYWLLMPFKWLDPGVSLAHRGERELEGEVYDVVELSFAEDVGLTSDDRYWGWVSRRTGRMERWEYVLQDESGEPGSGEPTAWSWGGWEETPAGVIVSTVKQRIGDGDVVISFPVAVLEADVSDREMEAIFSPDGAPGTGGNGAGDR